MALQVILVVVVSFIACCITIAACKPVCGQLIANNQSVYS